MMKNFNMPNRFYATLKIRWVVSNGQSERKGPASSACVSSWRDWAVYVNFLFPWPGFSKIAVSGSRRKTIPRLSERLFCLLFPNQYLQKHLSLFLAEFNHGQGNKPMNIASRAYIRIQPTFDVISVV